MLMDQPGTAHRMKLLMTQNVISYPVKVWRVTKHTLRSCTGIDHVFDWSTVGIRVWLCISNACQNGNFSGLIEITYSNSAMRTRNCRKKCNIMPKHPLFTICTAKVAYLYIYCNRPSENSIGSSGLVVSSGSESTFRGSKRGYNVTTSICTKWWMQYRQT